MLRIIHWFTIIYIIVLTLLLELPSVPPEIIETIGKPVVKYAHLVTFTLLGFLVELGRCKRSMRFWMSVLFLYAIGTEVLQWLLHPVCYRFFGWEDILNNIAGILFGTFIGHFCRPLVKRPSKSLDKKGENN